MLRRLHNIIPILCCLLFSAASTAQTLKAYEKKAEETYSERDYTGALAYYKQLIEIDSNRVDAKFYAGEAARQIRAFPIAEQLFLSIPDTAKVGFYSTTDFRIANVKKGLERYDEAILYYQKYIEKNPDTKAIFTKKALEELDYCEWALEVLNSPAQTKITKLDTGKINTNYIDFAPFKKDGHLYYTSALKYDQDEPAVTRIYDFDDVKETREIVPFSLQEKQHVSHTSYNAAGNRIFYTLCNDHPDFVGEYICKIYYRDLDKAGNWTGPRELPVNINLPGYTATQPSIASDENGEDAYLFFASDRPKGKGQLDLWVSEITIDTILKFKAPVALAELNTDEDDISPFYHNSSQTLFFSSEGHKSLGGFDVFKTKKMIPPGEDNLIYENWAAPKNMGSPLNSSYDDLYYTFSSQEGKAYFASNRPGSMCAAPEEGCTCTDIYEGMILVDLKTFVYNSIDSSALEGTTLELKDLTAGTIDTVQLNENGNLFLFPLRLDRDYQMTATKPEYDAASTTFNTKGIIETIIIERKLFLAPEIKLRLLTFDAVSRLPLNGTIIQLLNSTTNQDSVVFLPADKNSVTFDIDFKNFYQVTGAKKLYTTARDTFNTMTYTTPTVITIELFLNTFNLPLTLYFDNDKPRYVQRMDTTVRLTYEQTYQRYLNRQTAFRNGYAQNLTGGAVWVAHEEVDNFFKDEVKKGWDDLQEFCGLLLPYLKSGNKIDIIVEGYASPLASGDYNERLTKRRISSVINQLQVWQNGELEAYLENGNLIVKEEPKGEEAADKTISDDGRNRRASVYSPRASRERRVRILDVRKQESVMSWVEQDR